MIPRAVVAFVAAVAVLGPCEGGPSGVDGGVVNGTWGGRSEEHTSELQSQSNLVCRLLLEKKKNAVLTLALDVVDYLNSNNVWIATDGSLARRCVESGVYGTLDFAGRRRFPAPAEFIAAVIAYYVHPVNIQTAGLIMQGAECTENISNGVERPFKAFFFLVFPLPLRSAFFPCRTLSQ